MAAACIATESPDWRKVEFRWKSGGPLIDGKAPRAAAAPAVTRKDPKIVLHDGHWYRFGTLRMKSDRRSMQERWSEGAPMQPGRTGVLGAGQCGALALPSALA